MSEGADDAIVVGSQGGDQPGAIDRHGARARLETAEGEVVEEDQATASAIEESIEHDSRFTGNAAASKEGGILETAHREAMPLGDEAIGQRQSLPAAGCFGSAGHGNED